MFENRAPWADRIFKWVAPLVLIVSAAAGAFYYFWTHYRAAPPKVEARAAPPSTAQPAIRHPVPNGNAAQPENLPALNDSDPPMHEALEGLLGDEAFQKFWQPDDIIRRLVVTIDNLPRQKVAVERRPLKAAPGSTQVVIQGGLTTLGETNAQRYAPYMTVLEGADLRSLTDLYLRFYPLFQRAYQDLGYPDQYFNDRLVDVMDHLLAAPEPPGHIALTQPKVFYEYADPALESKSAGQKLMMRMGHANELAVKVKLRELRALVTASTLPRKAPHP